MENEDAENRSDDINDMKAELGKMREQNNQMNDMIRNFIEENKSLEGSRGKSAEGAGSNQKEQKDDISEKDAWREVLQNSREEKKARADERLENEYANLQTKYELSDEALAEVREASVTENLSPENAFHVLNSRGEFQNAGSAPMSDTPNPEQTRGLGDTRNKNIDEMSPLELQNETENILDSIDGNVGSVSSGDGVGQNPAY